MAQIEVSNTLAVGIHTNSGDVHATIERQGAGLVRVEPGELVGLVGALRAAAGELALSLERRERASGRLRATR